MTPDNDQIGTRVRLLVDLTSYHPAFKAGAEGIIVRKFPGELDQFFLMELPNGARLRVVCTSAEVVEPRNLEAV
jgi:hypothetical protein